MATRCCERGYKLPEDNFGPIPWLATVIGTACLVIGIKNIGADFLGMVLIMFGMIILSLFIRWNILGKTLWCFVDTKERTHFHGKDPVKEDTVWQREWFGDHNWPPIFKLRHGGWFRKCTIFNNSGVWTFSSWNGHEDCTLTDSRGRSFHGLPIREMSWLVRYEDSIQMLLDRYQNRSRTVRDLEIMLTVLRDNLASFKDRYVRTKYVQFVEAYLTVATNRVNATKPSDPPGSQKSFQQLWDETAEEFHLKRRDSTVAATIKS